MLKRLAQNRSARAFTLVELLVVIGIIAILVGILLPALNKAREQSNSLKCLSNLHTIGQAVAMYESAFSDWLPAGYTGNGTGDTHWDATLQQMLGRNGSIANDGAASAGMIGQAFLCPSHQVEPDPNGGYSCDYSAHPRLMPCLAGTSDKYDTALLTTSTSHVPMHQIRSSEIPHSSEVILVADGVQIAPGENPDPTYTANWSAQACLWEVDDGAYWWGVSQTGPGARLCSNGLPAPYLATQVEIYDKTSVVLGNNPVTDPYDAGNIAWRHMGNTAANCLFLDGHADSFTVGNKPAAVTVFVLQTGGPCGGSLTAPAPSYTTNLLRKYLYLPYR